MFRAPTPLLLAWLEEGWLRPVDVAFAAFLHSEADESCDTTLALAALTSLVVGAGHTCLDLSLLLGEPACLLPVARSQSSPGWSDFIGHWSSAGVGPLSDLLSASVSVGSDTDQRPLVLEAGRLYLRRYWCHECRVAEALERRLGAPAASPHLRDVLDMLYPANGDPADWQKMAAALGASLQVTIISGGPGTGKTTTVVKLLALLQKMASAEGKPPLRIALAAPTGKAAARLTSSISENIDRLPDAVSLPRHVQTLHRLLGYLPGEHAFRHHRHDPLHVDVLVIDEASMVDLEMMDAVLEALPSRARLILLGDKDQLASVEAGAVLGELCSRAHIGHYSPAMATWMMSQGAGILPASDDTVPFDDHVIMLRKSHRFPDDSAIGQLARAVNLGRTGDVRQVLAAADPQVQSLQTSDLRSVLRPVLVDTVHGWADHLAGIRDLRMPDTHDCVTDVDAWAASLLEAQCRLQILCAVREGAHGVGEINALVAGVLREQGLLSATTGWYAGRPVMVTRNDHSLGLMNGDVGLALPDPRLEGQLRVFFPLSGGGVRSVLPSRLGGVDTVFAMTVHKSQGSEFRHAVLVLPERDSPVLTRELVYTAITRARERVTLVIPSPDIFEQSIRRRVRRSSGLAVRLGLSKTTAHPSHSRPPALPIGTSGDPPTQLDLF